MLGGGLNTIKSTIYQVENDNCATSRDDRINEMKAVRHHPVSSDSRATRAMAVLCC